MIDGSLDDLVLPCERGGWWHEYVCPVHGVELDHVGLFGGSFPVNGVPCRHGCLVDSPAIRGAWTVLAHQACARRLAHEARSDDPAVRDRVARLLDEYAELYLGLSDEHEESQAWMTRGRLFHQALTEAIWAVSVGTCSRVLTASGLAVSRVTAELLQALAHAALRSRDQLIADGKFDSNYVAWLNAAGAVCSSSDDWLVGEHGQFAHVMAATGSDGWQWEASTYYHSFVLRAVEHAVRARPEITPPEHVRARISDMRRVLETLPWCEGQLPALHDGPWHRPGFDDELAELRLRHQSRADGVEVFADAGYALVSSAGLTGVLAFGPHGGSHGHLDKLSLSLYGNATAWQPDPGQVPYAHRAWRRWYAGTAAHPTFSIDGLDQAECRGVLVHQDADSVSAVCEDAYPGVHARRTVTRLADGLRDELMVQSESKHRIALHLRPDVDLDVRAGEPWISEWAGSPGLTAIHAADRETSIWVRPGPGSADDPQRRRTHVDWVADDVRSIRFTTTYRTGTPDHVAAQ